MDPAIPVTLLTGFLGSGKSTLLSQILTSPSFANAAVIVNEFGEIGLDDFLVAHSEEQVMQMTTGCLCCTIRGDISETLMDLFLKRAKGDVPKFERIIIETTGLADPAPVIQTLASAPGIFTRYSLEGIITTVDAANGLDTLDMQDECVKQAAVADCLVLTKTDLDIDEAALHDLRTRLKTLNPTAELVEKQASDFDLESLFDTTAFDVENKTLDVRKWLALDKIEEGENQGHDHHHHHHDDHHHHHHHHDVNKHGDQIHTFSLVFDKPLFSESFVFALKALVADHGNNLLRIKGVVCLQEEPDNPYLIHAVQHIFHDPITLDAWPTDDRRTRMVFITRKLPRSAIDAYFAPWLVS